MAGYLLGYEGTTKPHEKHVVGGGKTIEDAQANGEKVLARRSDISELFVIDRTDGAVVASVERRAKRGGRSKPAEPPPPPPGE